MTDQETEHIQAPTSNRLMSASFSTQSYVTEESTNPGDTSSTFLPDGLPYMGKLMHHIDAGKRLSLQVHDQKQESYILLDGDGWVLLEDADGEMEQSKTIKKRRNNHLARTKAPIMFAGESRC
jgi:hypothetical protein